MRVFRLLICVGLLAAPCAVAAPAKCELKKVATFDAKIDSGMLMVKAKIDDKDVWAALDTGSPYNMIDNKLVEELKLPTSRGYLAGIDVAGHESRVTATAHKVSLGDFSAKNLAFLVGGRDSADGSWGIDALFGANFLEANGIDLELDLAHGKVNLFLSDHCPDQGAYWAHEWVPIPIRIQNAGHIYLPVNLDGLDTYAMLDTGALRWPGKFGQ